ncbi:hypothetical protein DUNSADRAFT_15884 [Dunaliella salina]|uniref:MYND-type domain-containing protein n=1 Tax=Dunaliella salina TaxID=3046 RepID=A0ABQ7G4Q6_DUNSA|nr:hypothetical protein DUNSADRAFT_15884 [Dunaliella salina]|eukprot:KAF5829569.1 hypothetical protein DUNSADRAFT_15884 [Dunaliella salina]
MIFESENEWRKEWRDCGKVVAILTRGGAHNLLMEPRLYGERQFHPVPQVAVAVLIPADLLHDIVLPQSLPKWGIWGTAMISYEALMRGFARRAFTNSSSVWANAALTRVKFEASVMDKALEEVHLKIPGMEHHRTMEMHLKRSADKIYEEEARSNRRLLQITINKFWCLVVNNLRQRLSNRAKKIMCRESLNCDGIVCDYCRGAMVFQLASLEGQDNKAWSYNFRGQTFDSSTPKQYLRGEWRTALELCSLYQCNDADLLGCILLHDRRTGFPVALHVPAHLLELSMVRVPPKGVLFWKFLPHEGSLVQALEELLEKRAQSGQGHGGEIQGQGHVATLEGGVPEPGVQREQLPASNSFGPSRQAPGEVDTMDRSLLENVSSIQWGQKGSITADRPSPTNDLDGSGSSATQHDGVQTGRAEEKPARGPEGGPGGGPKEADVDSQAQTATGNSKEEKEGQQVQEVQQGEEEQQEEKGQHGVSEQKLRPPSTDGAVGPSKQDNQRLWIQHAEQGTRSVGESSSLGGGTGIGVGQAATEQQQHHHQQVVVSGQALQQPQQQLDPQQQLPLSCALPGCNVWEEGSTGVQLLLCACKRVAYCTREHQAMHWRAHCKAHRSPSQQAHSK